MKLFHFLLFITLIVFLNGKQFQLMRTTFNSEKTLVEDTILSKELFSNNEFPCTQWKSITNAKIFELLRRLDTISHQDQIKCFGSFDCGIKGELIFNKKLYNYHINAGGWVNLNRNEETIRLGSFQKKDTLDTFLSVYYCDTDWD